MEDRFAVGDIIRMKKPHPCGSHDSSCGSGFSFEM